MKMLAELRSRLSRIFRESPHIHIRERGVQDLAALVDLIDRFIDGDVRYGLEWDDFISWKQENPDVEAVRQRLGSCEQFLFSKNTKDRSVYISVLVAERNRAAARVGVPSRE